MANTWHYEAPVAEVMEIEDDQAIIAERIPLFMRSTGACDICESLTETLRDKLDYFITVLVCALVYEDKDVRDNARKYFCEFLQSSKDLRHLTDEVTPERVSVHAAHLNNSRIVAARNYAYYQSLVKMHCELAVVNGKPLDYEYARTSKILSDLSMQWRRVAMENEEWATGELRKLSTTFDRVPTIPRNL